MTRILDIRLSSSGGVLDVIRRVEYVILLAICATGLVFYQPLGFLLAGPLLVVALALVPRRLQPSPTWQRARLETLNDLQGDGLSIRSRWVALRETPLTDQKAVEQWRIQRDTLIWMANCSARLGRYPEVGGIFNAHLSRESLVDELDSCLQLLSRIRRMVSLSESLRLPI